MEPRLREDEGNSRAVSFPPELWFDEDLGGEGRPPVESEGSGIPERLEHLFETIKNPKTGELYTNAEVAPMSAGVLTEGDEEGIRTGRIADPPVGWLAALAAVFRVPPSYLLDRNTDLSVLDEEVLEALADETVGAIVREGPRLPQREKGIVLGIVRQFGSQIDDVER
jgi:hypothetical protein